MKFPSTEDIILRAGVLIGGAILAAVIVHYAPASWVKWIKDNSL